MIYCNGIPKSGTNILTKLMFLLGYTDSQLFAVSKSRQNTIRANYFNNQKKHKIRFSQFQSYPNTYYCHTHLIYNDLVFSNNRIINIWRDPREVIISYLRFRKSEFEVLESDIIDCINNGFYTFTTKGTIIDNLQPFLPLLSSEHVCNVSMKEMKNHIGIQKILDYLQFEQQQSIEKYTQDLFTLNNIPYTAEGKTHMKQASSLSQFWTEQSEITWQEIGGQEFCNTISQYVEI